VKVEKLAKNGEMVQNSQPLSPGESYINIFQIHEIATEIATDNRRILA
jgi:hypothetical protein